MSTDNSNNTESLSAAEPTSPAAFDIESLSPRQQRVVLVCDVVESVRWMEHDEDNAITRWSQFATAVRSRIAPAYGGEVIKSTGDGLMMQFQAAPGAVAAANAMQKIASEGNQGYAPERQMHLRIGIHQTQVRRDAHDLYGHGVNLAARITTLAGPGEIIVTPEVRDHLTDSLDGEIEDMGECYLKHVGDTQRVYRVGEQGAMPVLKLKQDDPGVMQVSIAVLPLEARAANPENDAIGDLISDGVISELSKVAQLRVISRLSSGALRNRRLTPQEIGSVLGCRYVLSGSYFVQNQKVVVTVELTKAKDGKVIWSDRLTKEIADLLQAQSELIGNLAYQVHTQIVQTEFQLGTAYPLPTVQSYSLLLSSITLMHRMSKRDFAWSQKILHELISRHPRSPTPRAWLAKWHNLAIAQGWSEDVDRDAKLTHSIVNSALDINPKDSLALSIRALALGYVDKKFDEASQAYQDALLINPNESLAWIGTATLNTWLGNEAVAVDAAQKALLLSPLDPLKYYFYGMAAAAMLVGNRLPESIELAKKSIRLNSGLSATRRVLVITYVLNNQIDMAKQTAIELQQIDPDFTIQKFKSTSPLYRSPNGEIYADALRAAEVKL